MSQRVAPSQRRLEQDPAGQGQASAGRKAGYDNAVGVDTKFGSALRDLHDGIGAIFHGVGERKLRREAVVDCDNKETVCCKCSDETFIVASMSYTPSASVENKDDGELAFFRGLRIIARWMVEEKIEFSR